MHACRKDTMDDRESLGRQVVETANQISYGMGKAK
jgi:hypothetical protein